MHEECETGVSARGVRAVEGGLKSESESLRKSSQPDYRRMEAVEEKLEVEIRNRTIRKEMMIVTSCQ